MPSAAKPAVDALGRAIALSRPTSSKLLEMPQDAALVAFVEKWKVGPDTKLNDWRDSSDEPLWFTRLLMGCGTVGLEKLVDMQVPLDASAYALAFRAVARGKNEDEEVARVLDTWNALLAQGVDPRGPMLHGATLWHGACEMFHPDLIAFAQAYGGDWDQEDDYGVRPLQLLMRNCQDHSEEFFCNPELQGGGGAFLAQARQMVSEGAPGEFLAELEASLPVARMRTERAREQALAMVRGGVDPFRKTKNGHYPMEELMPEQIHMEEAILAQTPDGQDPDEAVNTMLMFGDMDAMAGMRSAYPATTRAFIEAIEKLAGKTFLHDNPLATPAAEEMIITEHRRPKP